MKTRLLLLMLLAPALHLQAQESPVYNYFNKGIDAIAAEANVIGDSKEDEKTNHVYSRMFSSPVLYSDVIERAFSNGNDDAGTESDMLAMDDKRTAVIDKLLLDVYTSHPDKVAMTEEQLRSENAYSGVDAKEKKLAMSLSRPSMDIPENVDGGMKTTVVKPNYWSTMGRIGLKFTQNYISGNWFQGGESNNTMLGELDFDLNYDDKNRITFKTHFDVDLGFATTKADTLHSFKTNTDRLRIESTFGYKLVKNLDIAAKMKLESQSLPNYPTNSPDFVSNFMAPFDANFSVGLNYKPTWEKFRCEVYFAPLSAYNYRFVRYGSLVERYGIRQGRHHKEDFGTQLVVTVPSQRIFGLVDWYSRAEYYTNYARVFFQWENKFDVSLNRYLTASLSLHARFDDSAPGLYDNDYGYWQIKEFMTLGVTYSW
ncbi:MAG: DUF3078 domain-containing protein [Bacteroidaceae bacterium]|nr:DUF3078 domain-containing protein [Bacteroidaceae bacterium]